MHQCTNVSMRNVTMHQCTNAQFEMVVNQLGEMNFQGAKFGLQCK